MKSEKRIVLALCLCALGANQAKAGSGVGYAFTAFAATGVIDGISEYQAYKTERNRAHRKNKQPSNTNFGSFYFSRLVGSRKGSATREILRASLVVAAGISCYTGYQAFFGNITPPNPGPGTTLAAPGSGTQNTNPDNPKPEPKKPAGPQLPFPLEEPTGNFSEEFFGFTISQRKTRNQFAASCYDSTFSIMKALYLGTDPNSPKWAKQFCNDTCLKKNMHTIDENCTGDENQQCKNKNQHLRDSGSLVTKFNNWIKTQQSKPDGVFTLDGIENKMAQFMIQDEHKKALFDQNSNTRIITPLIWPGHVSAAIVGTKQAKYFVEIFDPNGYQENGIDSKRSQQSFNLAKQLVTALKS